MQGGVSIILDQPDTTKFFIFSYSHRIYEFDVVTKNFEERNMLTSNIPIQGAGF
jgi:hypothetical protein